MNDTPDGWIDSGIGYCIVHDGQATDSDRCDFATDEIDHEACGGSEIGPTGDTSSSCGDCGPAECDFRTLYYRRAGVSGE